MVTDTVETSAAGLLHHDPRALEVLTTDDLRTLEEILRSGMGENSLRALKSDLAYLQAWSHAACFEALPWPPDLALVMKFVAHHLWVPEERTRNPQHGMPEDVAQRLRTAGFLRRQGPHAIATVRRRLSHWRSLCNWRGLEHPFDAPDLRRLLRNAGRARIGQAPRKSLRAITLEDLTAVSAHLEAQMAAPGPGGVHRLAALRDRALILVGFHSGGRRRSELGGLQVSMLERLEPVPDLSSAVTAGAVLPAMAIHLGRTKTSGAQGAAPVHITGETVDALTAWLKVSGIVSGPIFRRIDRWANIGPAGLSGEAVNQIVKRRLGEIGDAAGRVSAHGLRSGYLTEAARLGLTLPQAMAQSGHRSVDQAARYFDDGAPASSAAAQLATLRRKGEPSG